MREKTVYFYWCLWSIGEQRLCAKENRRRALQSAHNLQSPAHCCRIQEPYGALPVKCAFKTTCHSCFGMCRKCNPYALDFHGCAPLFMGHIKNAGGRVSMAGFLKKLDREEQCNLAVTGRFF